MDQKDRFAETQFMACFAGVDATCAVFPSIVDSSEVPQVQFWGRPWEHAAYVQLSALTTGVRGRFFGALCMGTRPPGSVHRDITPGIRCTSRAYLDRHIRQTHRQNQPPTTPLLLPPFPPSLPASPPLLQNIVSPQTTP